MASGDRFYQLEMTNRPVLKGDLGSLIKIEGLVVGGGGAHAVLLLPSAGLDTAILATHKELFSVHVLSLEQWTEYLQHSDVPEILMPDKAFHRKARYEISGAVQQKIWVADGLICQYCGKKMGDVQLTIDHFIPLELGGVNNQSNYLSACRRCNKNKGSIDPKKFCTPQKFLELQHYLQHRKV